MTNLEQTFLESATRYFRESQSKEIDWEQRRYEIAKDVLIAWYSNPNRIYKTLSPENCTKEAVRPLIALITKDDGTEYLQTYLPDGRISEAINYIDDLFFDTEKHEGWINLAINSSGEIFVATNHPHKDEKTAKLAVSDKSNVVATCKITWEE